MKMDPPAPLTGTVECDETYVGGTRRGHGKGIGNYTKNKTIVLGIIERGGEIRLRTTKSADRKSLHSFIREHAPNPSRIITDELPAYLGCGDADTMHETVEHGAKEYVRGDVHTNTVES